MSECYSNELTFCLRNWDVILNRAKNYYENDKEGLRELARDKYRKLSEKDENRKREYGKGRYCNISKEKKQILKAYQKNYWKAKKPEYDNE